MYIVIQGILVHIVPPINSTHKNWSAVEGRSIALAREMSSTFYVFLLVSTGVIQYSQSVMVPVGTKNINLRLLREERKKKCTLSRAE